MKPTELKYYGSFGIPGASCVIEYDSIQRMLLVGTDDGRIKVVGTACIECTLTSPQKTASISLHVLPNTGCFLRLDSIGTLELWSLPQRKCLFVLKPDIGDSITSCRPLTHSPFVLVGLGSGYFKTVGLFNAAGELVGPARPISTMAWTAYELDSEHLGVPEDSELLEIACQHHGDDDVRVLLRHEYNTVTLLAMADHKVLGQLKCGGSGHHFKQHKSDVTAICWANNSCDQVLTGHEDGSIVHWRLARDMGGGFTRCKLYCIAEEEPRDAVHSLSLVLEATISEHMMSIVVCGGNMADAPRSVALLHVEPVTDMHGEVCLGDLREVRQVPWFGQLQGFALVRPRGSLKVQDVPTAVVTLTQGGYLCIHDIATGKTEPFVGDFQAQSVALSQLALIPRLHDGRQGFLFERLVRHAPAWTASEGWHWALHSGHLHPDDLEPAQAAQEVLLTGHDNGTVVLWDVRQVSPQRVSTAACGAKAAVTAMRLQEATGLLATGHGDGEVNVLFWHPCGTESAHAPPMVLAASHSGHQSSGSKRRHVRSDWRHTLVIVAADVAAMKEDRSVVDMAWLVQGQAQSLRVLLAIAWASGHVAVVDFSHGPESPSWLWEQNLSSDPLGSVSFMAVPAKLCPGGVDAPDSETEVVLVVATHHCCFIAVHATTGDKLAGHYTVPKTKEPLISCVPLAADGTPAMVSDTGIAASWIPRRGAWEPLHHASHQQAPFDADAALSRAAAAMGLESGVSPDDTHHTGYGMRNSRAGEHEDADGHNRPLSPFGDMRATESTLQRDTGGWTTEGGESHGFDSAPSGELEAAWSGELPNTPRSTRRKGGTNVGKRLQGVFSGAKRLTVQAASGASAMVRDAKESTVAWKGLPSSMRRRGSQSLSQPSSPVAESAHRDGKTSGPFQSSGLGSGSHSQPPSPLTSTPTHSIRNSQALSSTPPVAGRAEWILIVSRDAARLYPVSAAFTGNRKTTTKVRMESTLDGAALVATPASEPLLVCWSAEAGIQMLPLPALDACGEQDLVQVTGWRWNWKADVLASKHIKHVFAACTPTGLATIVGPCRELLLLGLCRPLPDLRPPEGFFDPDLASAAFSAECQDAPSTRVTVSQLDVARKADGMDRGGATAGLPGLLKGVERRLKGQRTVNVAESPSSWIGSPSEGGRVSTDAVRTDRNPCCGVGPKLKELFLSDTEWRESHRESLQESANASHAPGSPTRAAVGTGAAGVANSVRVAAVATRSDGPGSPAHGLGSSATTPMGRERGTTTTFGHGRGGSGTAAGSANSVAATTAVASSSTGAGPSKPASTAAPPPRVVQRSASEIRSAYGRDRATTTADVMSENISRLKQRQERLQGLEDRASDLAKGAEDFASMARKLKEQQSKPWWKPF